MCHAIQPRISKCERTSLDPESPGGALLIFRVRGRAIGEGIYFPDNGIKNGINVHNFGIRNGTDFHNFSMICKIGYIFSKIWYKVGCTPGGVTPILDLTGCAAHNFSLKRTPCFFFFEKPKKKQGVLLREKLCDRVSFSDKNYASGYYN